jgi:hypothetical protein
MKIFGLIIILFLSNAYAQEKPEAAPLALPEEKFAAIVQYANGKQEYDFKDLISFNKIITIPQKAYLKVITQKRCVAVFYENTKVQTPADKVSPWKILSGSARWICPEDKIEKVNFKDSELQVQNGEFLINNNQLTVLRNNIKYDNKNLDPQIVYSYKESKWEALDDQPEPYEHWLKQDKFPAPLESARLKMEKPDDPYVTRLFLNVAPIGISGIDNHEHGSSRSDYGMQSHSFRLGLNFPWKNKSALVFLEYDETDGNNNKGMGPPPLGFKDFQLKSTTLGVGLRHSHVSKSSFYYYLGLTKSEVKFTLHPDPITFFNGELVYPYNVSAGAGYQKIFWAKNWLSLMVGLDLKITQSLSQGRVDNFNHPPGITSDMRSMMTSYSGFLYLGPVFNF